MKKTFIIFAIAVSLLTLSTLLPRAQAEKEVMQLPVEVSSLDIVPRTGSGGIPSTADYPPSIHIQQPVKNEIRENIIEEKKPFVEQPHVPVVPAFQDIVSSFSPSALWKNRPDGPYSQTQAAQDFNSGVTGWDQSRFHLVNGKLRTTLLKNVVGPAGGEVSWIDIPDADEYELKFDMMFDQNFDFSQGGKVGFGFLIGDGNTGGAPAWSGNGGSVRLMWYKNTSNSPVILKPYVYYKDQSGQYGDDFGKVFPSSGSITKGTWHTVKMHVKSNTGNNTDGLIQITIDGTTILDQPIRFTSNNSKRLINRITFETFRGGADSSWESNSDGEIYFDNVSWTAI